MPQRGLNPQAYRIGWICPLEVEQIAAMDMLDEEHESLPQNPADHNVYKFGSINHHNIVIAGLPTPGNCSAAIVVAQMRMTFPNLRYGLLVGIGGGVPVRTETGIIRLGHVVVGTPTGIHSGTIQYDYGKAMEGSFERTGSIPPPPTFLLNAARALAAERASLDEDPIWKDAQRPLERSRTVRGSGFGFPGAVNDHLFPAHYTHQQAGKSCTEGGCDMNQRIDRHVGKVEESFVVVHRGTIASGELVVKTAVLRDRLADQNGVLCFEMEAAEALADFPCMVIRGISDYCDSHKNDQWHGYAAAVAAAYARQLFFHLLQEEPHNNDSLAKFQLPSTLPAVREADQFIARTDELRQLHSILSTNSRRRTAVVHGLGGIGKTQLTLEYCERHRTEYSSIIWLNARDESSLKQSFTCVAERILSYDPSMIYIATALKSQDTDGVIRAVKCWLDEPANDGWLLICDKYDHPSTDMNIKRSGQITMTGGNHLDEEATTGHQNQVVVEEFDLRLYLPETDHGAVIITSRQSVKMGRPIKVGKLLAVDDSLAILASTSGRLNIKLEPGAVDIARQLDGVPLALATTGAYLNQVAMTCAKYFQLYNESWLQLHEDHPLLPSYDRILYSTWNLSHEHIKQQEPAAAMVLQQWAYFSNGDMWYELLKEDWETKPGWLTEVTKDKLQFHKVMRVLCKHGLAEISPSPRSDETESQGYSVHDCVHSWMEYVLNQGTNDIMLGSAIHCVALHAHSQDQKDLWRVQQRLLVHADRCLTMAKAMDPDAEVTVALGELGFIFTCQGRLQDAEIVLQRALARKEKALGPDHISTINTVNNLGLVYIDQGRLQDAEFMLQRALASKEKALAPDCISTLETVNNLGILYMDQRRLEEAEAMYQRALEGYEKELGPDHISTINTVNSLGGLYKDQGRLQDAEASIQRALEGYEKALGPDHITTLETVHNLGIFYAVQGRLEDAEALFQRALEGKEKVCGPDDISTFYTVNNLGLHYQAQGRLHDAEAMFQRAVKGYEKAFGPTPAVTYVPFLTTVENLARLYVMLGRTGDALLFDQRALVGAEAVWGRDNQRYTRIAGWVAQHQRSHD